MRYGIVTLVVVVLVILGAVAIFGRGGSNTPAKAARLTKLAEYSDNDTASLSWTMQGKLVGEDERKSVRVTVTKDSRKIEVLSGYDERVEKSQDYTNSQAAFAAFTRALDGLSFGRERDVTQPDERGVCPQGYRYIYRLTDGREEQMRTWSTSCKVTDGNFGGTSSNASQIAQLFKRQIGDYSKFVSGVRF